MFSLGLGWAGEMTRARSIIHAHMSDKLPPAGAVTVRIGRAVSGPRRGDSAAADGLEGSGPLSGGSRQAEGQNMSQKFHKDDHVQVGDMPPYMSHFTGNCEAIVIGSYADQYGGGNRERATYTLNLKEGGHVSWYEEDQLTLIRAQATELAAQWEKEAAELKKQHTDLDWIFANGKAIVKSAPGHTVGALAELLGVNLWGSRGEGITYYCNSLAVMEIAHPFLLAGDKDGFLAFVKEAKRARA